MTPDVKAALYDYLSGFATENKRRKIEQVLDHRTRYVTVVLEDIYQPQNASAVVRSCDCFGVQDLYVIENRNIFEVKAGVVLGASKWVDIHRFNHTNIDNTVACLTELKKRGYRLVATTPIAMIACWKICRWMAKWRYCSAPRNWACPIPLCPWPMSTYASPCSGLPRASIFQ
ncbi:MAG: TrmH family RNA methyltransferase [candidate division KSB1 bacterium]|nr:TrmH family RNA methyltransferase [candidate division KSB1 bacterium]